MFISHEVIKGLISEYVAGLELNLTEESCLCGWITMETAFGERKVKTEVNLDCPVHTREGLILAFVTEVLAKLPDNPLTFTDEWKPTGMNEVDPPVGTADAASF